MSERKLYEIALRILGISMLLHVVTYFILLIQQMIAPSGVWDSYRVTLTYGFLFLGSFGASLFLILKSSLIAGWCCRNETPIPALPMIAAERVLGVGIVLVGVYFLAKGIPNLLGNLVTALTQTSSSAMPVSIPSQTTGQFVAPLLQCLIGLALMFHKKLLSGEQGLARFLKETQEGSDEDDEWQRPKNK